VSAVSQLIRRYMERLDTIPLLLEEDIRHQFLSECATLRRGGPQPDVVRAKSLWTYVDRGTIFYPSFTSPSAQHCRSGSTSESSAIKEFPTVAPRAHHSWVARPDLSPQPRHSLCDCLAQRMSPTWHARNCTGRPVTGRSRQRLASQRHRSSRFDPRRLADSR
jgi:hypothetical protein